MPFVRANNCDFHYEDHDFTDPWKPRETVFMQPHLCSDTEDYRAWVPTLSRHYRVIRVDRRGLGQSSVPPLGYEYTLQNQAEDMLALLDALGLDRVHYVGTSGSGVMGLYLAAHHPQRMLSLTAVSTPITPPAAVKARFLREGYADAASAVMGLGTWLFYHTAEPLYTSRIPLLNEYFKARLATRPAHVVASHYRMVTRADFNAARLLPQLTVPTLLISSEHSFFTSEEQRNMVRSMARGEMHVIPGSDSPNPTLDRPDECARAALEFMQGNPRGKG